VARPAHAPLRAQAGAGEADGVMSAQAQPTTVPAAAQPDAPPAAPGAPLPPDGAEKSSRKGRLLAFLAVWFGGTIVIAAIVGKSHRNNEFQPQNEFKLDNWVHLGIFSINKAVLYLFLAGIATCVTMIYVARRMQQRPNKVQTAVEALYQL